MEEGLSHPTSPRLHTHTPDSVAILAQAILAQAIWAQATLVRAILAHAIYTEEPAAAACSVFGVVFLSMVGTSPAAAAVYGAVRAVLDAGVPTQSACAIVTAFRFKYT